MAPTLQRIFDAVNSVYEKHGFELVCDEWNSIHTCTVEPSQNYDIYDITVRINTKMPDVGQTCLQIIDDVEKKFEKMGYIVKKKQPFFDFYFMYLNVLPS